ncbi:AMP-dependent synthetase [Bradyrhizobium sp. CCBAU 65884]|uniref:AMP-dependent synthetase/ligase n=1 Tax=Bradyrhizobium sp. CCBAU 65884 TaxID=722477 RepID=UPI0023057708|nr:AMP-binding protein [Bradyrhizobium sp. CCBAU 65884]MDA9474699.1 AMP-dependent synthetase [Bradyrhizobium sp. CCBAU 65884]
MTVPSPASGAQYANVTIPSLLQARSVERAGEVAFRQKRNGQWLCTTWQEYASLVCRISAAMKAVGLNRGDRVAIMGDVSQEWLLADMATICSGAVTVGIYFTSSPEEVDYYLRDSGARIGFVGGEPQLRAFLAGSQAAALDKIVIMDPGWSGASPANNVTTLVDFIGAVTVDAAAALAEEAAIAKASDIATIGYTSGTTGYPKGAILSHTALLAGAHTNITFCPPLATEPQRVAVHLPMSHTVARAQATTKPLITRVVPHFGETTAEFAATIREVKPTFYMAPPRFYQRNAALILSKVQSGSGRFRQNYKHAMRIAKTVLAHRQAGREANPFLDGLFEVCREQVFRPLLAEVGFDQLTYPYTASAPMPSEVMTLWQLWGLNLKECYGQTEMVGGNLGQMADWSKAGTVGIPVQDPAWETRVLEDGEMIVRGPGLFTGYWNKPAETQSALKDGWLYTGDIVQVQPDGSYKLVDRKKEIINTSGGKSVSPTQIENELRQSPYISEAAVIGEGRKYLTALIEVDATAGMDWARSRDDQVREYKDLAKSEIVIRLIEGEVAKANMRLARVEQIKSFRILPEELSPDTGVMTPTRKKRRKPLMERYKSLIDTLYDDSEEQLIKEQLSPTSRSHGVSP